jgi:GDP-L-fucose synthase
MMEKNAKVYIAGHRGMVGSAIERELRKQGYTNFVNRTSKELDLTRQDQVEAFFATEKPEYVFLAAAKVGGIHANNTYPADFAYQNLMMECNVIHSSYLNGVKKLLFLGSSCIYPRMAPQPIPEDALLTGALEPTNEAYALAKISGLRMCAYYRKQYGCDFISAMPTNLYGYGDNFDLQNSHVLPALIRKAHDAKVKGLPFMEVWGSGTPLREFLYVDDLAEGLVFLMNNYSEELHVNIGSGTEVTIRELAQTVVDVVGFQGELRFDPTKPDGTPRKVMDVSRINAMGWKSQTGLRDGIAQVYQWFQAGEGLRGLL